MSVEVEENSLALCRGRMYDNYRLVCHVIRVYSALEETDFRGLSEGSHG